MDYDFTGLTRAQENMLTNQGWDKRDSFRRPNVSTVNTLMDRGLLLMFPIAPGSTYPQCYIVPIPVHIAWWEYCASRAKRFARA